MKTYAVVLGALLASAGPAFAHGGAGGGAPVMLPGGGPPVTSQVVPIGQSGMTPVTVPWTRDFPSSRVSTADRKRERHENQYVGSDYAICNPRIRPATPIQVYEVKGGPPVCGQDVVTQNGMLWLPPAFVW